MEPIHTTLEFIVNDARFQEERPFSVHVSPNDKYDPTDHRLNTVRWEDRPITVSDMRLLKGVTLRKNGFQSLMHTFSALSIDRVTAQQVEQYQVETEDFLKDSLKAEKVICYDYRLRRNGPRRITGSAVDINQPLVPDLPPRGAHNITFQNGPEIIKKVLKETRLTQFLDQRYRFRIVNTWRPLVPRLEDRPLAICDFQTVDGNDLLACDQIYSGLRTETYYLKYNPGQRWYWLSYQKPEEVMLMLMYDTKPGDGAKCEFAAYLVNGGADCQVCPHVAFENPKAGPHAPPRESVETRSIVISLASDE